VPTVVTIHDLIPLLLPGYRGGTAVRAYTALVTWSGSRADMVLTDSHAARQDILRHLGVPKERVRTVHLAAGPEYRPGSEASDAAAIRRLKLPEQYVLYLGGFDVRKNVRTALAAYARAASEIGTICPLVVGGHLPERHTEFQPDPRVLAADAGLGAGLVRFLGRVDEADKPAVYRRATAFLFPSRYEGFGLPPLEAMACGTPVVGSSATSLPEVVGEGGVLFDPGDAVAMARALVRLATDSRYRSQLSDRAIAQAARFTWQRTAQQTLAAYHDAVRVSSVPR
jgi:glycosyltransferase involved in cell wall biosynthesis